MKQQTLKAEFSVNGKGLHSGVKVEAIFKPAPENSGYLFKRIDLEGSPVIEALAENVVATNRGTVLGCKSNKDIKVGTIEHALAALYAAGIDNCIIEINGPELPILDGSAIEYCNKIEEAGLVEQNAEKEFLAANAQDPDVMVTESGLQYRIVKEGNGKRPSDTSGVRVHYEGKLIDGTVFDSSFDSDEPVEFNVDGLIPGMTEGLKLMSEGAEYILYIPSELGYGAFSPAEIIPAYSTLIFNVELLQVTDRIKYDDDDFSDYDNNYRASDLDATIEGYDYEDD